MKRKIFKLISTTLLLSSLLTFTSLASWEQSEQGWKYKDDTTGVYSTKGWYWIDGNSDGIAECYYLDVNGIMAINTEIEGYAINTDGQWTVNNVVQIKNVEQSVQNSGTANNMRIPSLSDISGGVDNSEWEGSCGDSTGLPPMQAGTGDNDSDNSNVDWISGNIGTDGDWGVDGVKVGG